MIRKCPVCKCKLTVKDYSDHNYEESYEACEYGCKQYYFESWCGNWKTTLGSTELVEAYNSSKTRFKKNRFIYKRILRRLRKKYRKQAVK